MTLWAYPIQHALDIKRMVGQKKYEAIYGTAYAGFVGDPWVELYEELLDSINYSTEAGPAAASIREDLWKLAEKVRARLLDQA